MNTNVKQSAKDTKEGKAITKDMSIREIIDRVPDSAEVIMQGGLHCLGCAMAHFETFEEGARAHGLSDKKIEDIIAKINELAKK